jgi:hypothetical protein
MRFLRRWPNMVAHTAVCVLGFLIFTIASHL